MQEINEYTTKMASKSDAELLEYTQNVDKYREEAIVAAISELEDRGITKEEFDVLKKELSEVISNKYPEKFSVSEEVETKSDQNNLPLLYTPVFIRVFGLLFSVFGGGILMAMNFSKLGRKDLVGKVVIVALLYSLLQGIIVSMVGPQGNFLSIPISFGGLLLLENMFWKKHVNNVQPFMKRNFLPPLIIGLSIAAMFAIGLVYMVNNGYITIDQPL